MSVEENRLRFEKFFRTEYNKLVNFVRKNFEERFFGSTPEDIVQDVAMSFLDKLDFDQQIENFAGYVYRSLKNKTIDINKQKKITESADKERNFDLLKLKIDADSFEPEKDFLEELGISEEKLHQSILKLKPDEQAIIMLTEFEGRSYADLSEKWDIPIGTLLSRKHRALAKLYKLLVNNENKQSVKIKNDGNKRLVLREHEMAQ